MADEIVRYRGDRTTPGFRRPDVSGAVDRANDLQQQASFLGGAAQGYEKAADITLGYQDMAYKLGADMAEHRGKTKPVEMVRDKDGMLAPMNESWTLSIEGKVYQDRQAQAWSNQAYLDFQEESNKAYQQYKNDPAQFREHMAGFTEELLEKAPGSKRDQLELQLRNHMEAQAFGLEGVNTRAAERAGDVATANAISWERSDNKALIARGERFGYRDGDKFVLNPTIAEKIGGMFERLGGMSDPYMARTQRVALARELTQDMFDGYYVGEAHRAYANQSLNPEQVDAELARIAEEVYSGELEVPAVTGFTGDGAPIIETRKFNQLGQDEQESVRQSILNRHTTFMRLREAERIRDINSFVYESATRVMNKIDSIAFNVPNEWRQTIEDTAMLNGVPPYLVAAIMKQENGTLDPNATNPQKNSRGEFNGGKGLMQTVQSTFDAFKAAAGVPNGNIYDPLDNIRVGVTYMGFIRKQILQDDKWGIADSPGLMDQLIAYGYKAGHGALQKMMRSPGFDPEDNSTWIDVEKVSGFDQNALAYVWDVTEKSAAMGGGATSMMQVWKDQASRRYGNDPVAYMESLNKMRSIAQTAESARAYNDSLTWQPIGLTEGAVNRWVGASWMRMYDPAMDDMSHFESNWSTVMNHLDPNNPMAQAVNSQMMAQYQNALKSNKTSGDVSLLTQIMQPPHTTQTFRDAEKLDQYAGPSGQAPDVLDFWEGQINSSLAQGTDPKQVAKYASAEMVNAFSLGGNIKNGFVPRAAISFFGKYMERLASGTLDPVTAEAGALALRGMIGISPRAVDTPQLGRGQRQPSSARATLANLAKHVGAPVGLNRDAPNPAAITGSKRAMQFIAQNAEIVSNPGDKNHALSMRILNDMLNGNAPEGSWERENDPEKQTAIANEVTRYMASDMVVGGLHYLAPKLAGKTGQIDYEGSTTILKDYMSYLSKFYGGEMTNDYDLMLENAVEFANLEGSLGMSYLTLPSQSMTSREDYSPMYGAYLPYPVEMQMPQQSIVNMTLFDKLDPDMTINKDGEDIPVRRGAAQGWIADALEGKYEYDQVIDLYRKGHVKLQFYGWDYGDPDYPAPMYGIFTARQDQADETRNPTWHIETIASARDMVKLATDKRWQAVMGMVDQDEWEKTTKPNKAMRNMFQEIKLRQETPDKPMAVEGIGKVYAGDKDWFPDFIPNTWGESAAAANLPGGEEFGGGRERGKGYGVWRNRFWMDTSDMSWFSLWPVMAPFQSAIQTNKEARNQDEQRDAFRKRTESIISPP